MKEITKMFRKLCDEYPFGAHIVFKDTEGRDISPLTFEALTCTGGSVYSVSVVLKCQVEFTNDAIPTNKSENQ